MSSEKRTPPKACYFGRFCHNNLAASPTSPSPLLDLALHHHRRTSSPRSHSRRLSSGCPSVARPHRHLRAWRHGRSGLSIFSSPRLIWWFNLYFIQFLLLDSYLFIDSLNCIRFLLLDSYGESIMLEVGTQTKERKFIKE